MLTHYGMSGHLASWGGYDEPALVRARYNPELMSKVEAILQEQLERAKAIVSMHRQAALELWDQLVERKQLSGEEVRSVLKNSTELTQ